VRRGVVSAVLSLSFVLASAGAARADDAAIARQLFDEATAAFEAGSPAEARALLRRSLSLHPTSAAAYNLARLAEIEQDWVEAYEVLAALSAEGYGVLPAGRAAEIRSALERATAHVARWTIETHRSGQLVVDGVDIGPIEGGAPFEHVVVPGPHEARLVRDGTLVATVRLSLRAGERRTVHLEAAEARPEPAARRAADLEHGDESDGPSALAVSLWIALGVVVAAGAAVAIIWVATSGEDDNVLPVTNVLRF
jgi:hypothetical protein